MTADLKRRPSGVPGLAIQDVPKGVAVKGGKYAIVHEASGGLLGFYLFKTVKAAKAAAAAVANDVDWTQSRMTLVAGTAGVLYEADLVICRHWLAQR